MNISQQVLISLLSAAIRGQKPQGIPAEGVDWEEVYEEAVAHDVYTLAYTVVKDLGAGIGPDVSLMEKWQKAALVAAMLQTQHIERIGQILDCFNQSQIPVIALKGLVVRDLYHQPELRTMSDADLLVKEQDYIKAKNILTQLGYKEYDSDSKQTLLTHNTYQTIELHKKLIDHEIIDKAALIEDSVWDNAISYKLCNKHVLTLSWEDNILYLCLHMAIHLINYGFGVRLLCDIVLVVESRNDEIDWPDFYKKAKELGIERFACAIFICCKKLFNMDVSNCLKNIIIDDDPLINEFIEDIISSGVYGLRSTSRYIGSSIIRYSTMDNSKFLATKLLLFLFPLPHKLRNKYEYGRKHRILLPIAWMHRILSNIFRWDILMIVKALFSPHREYKNIAVERGKLLRWLELR